MSSNRGAPQLSWPEVSKWILSRNSSIIRRAGMRPGNPRLGDLAKSWGDPAVPRWCRDAACVGRSNLCLRLNAATQIIRQRLKNELQHSVRLWKFLHAGDRRRLLRCCHITPVAEDSVSLKIFMPQQRARGAQMRPSNKLLLRADVVRPDSRVPIARVVGPVRGG
ncbi:hypothetical protein BU25DRAFT_248019 [Macroventuria anomochaeta]|uniref:Uncharacterized protein n=1 Tax=Macroventuria anomochaeta TaxID=301207 RepID=A0ACB6S9J9_9PLEO|nr:uncharacterized protein BU25DRAFT_248019 [Macroventuria anomochaeta]KAF2630791.1 hypothetical protein BU25DRAFT_248019 [Macroventuria anomochaeta]